MPDIPVGGQVFDLAFHPTHSTVYTALLTGEVKAFRYDEQGCHEPSFTCRPSKRSCRSLALNADGSSLWSVGKSKAIHIIDTQTSTVVETRIGAHESPINRIKHLTSWVVATGDDEGVIKLWDPRQQEAIRSYNQHFDFITDFLWLEDKKHLVATSGDGTLSVIDVRSKKTEPFAHSEDQEDELLSILPIKGGSKVVVGTQLGILSIFSRKKGWGDCVDRVPGHPQSIDALCSLPSSYNSSSNTILTGSSDGLIRVVEVLPTKLVGVIAEHGDFPVERIAIDQGGEGRWMASAGHEDFLKMTDLKEVLEDDVDDVDDEQTKKHISSEEHDDVDNDSDSDKVLEETTENTVKGKDEHTSDGEEGSDSESEADSDSQNHEKRKRKPEKDPLGRKRKKGRSDVHADAGFFSGL